MATFSEKMQHVRTETDSMREAREGFIQDLHQFRQDLDEIGDELRREAAQQRDERKKTRLERCMEVQGMMDKSMKLRLYNLSQHALAHDIWFGTTSSH